MLPNLHVWTFLSSSGEGKSRFPLEHGPHQALTKTKGQFNDLLCMNDETELQADAYLVWRHVTLNGYNQAPIVRSRLDTDAIHRINRYRTDSVVCFANTYPLDSDI